MKKKIEINCKILIVNEGKIETNETAKIKVKDETRAYLSPKFPYSINFSSNQKILDFKGKYRNWELISNYFDRSLLRNSIVLKISELMKFEYTVKCKPVDVIINGNFKGNYYICDSIEVGNNRINISKISENNLKKSNKNGGYLMQNIIMEKNILNQIKEYMQKFFIQKKIALLLNKKMILLKNSIK